MDNYSDREFEECEVSTEDTLVQEMDTEEDKELARAEVIRFFKDKTTWDGQPILLDKLLSEDNIQMVLNASIETAMEIIYATLNSEFDEMDDDSGLIGDDVKIVLSAMRKCSEAKIRQKYMGGMTLLYLEFCKGLNFE